jgi:hypothetical protein
MRLMRIGPVGAERPVLLDGDEALEASSVVMDFDPDLVDRRWAGAAGRGPVRGTPA